MKNLSRIARNQRQKFPTLQLLDIATSKKNMGLSGQQRKELQFALIDAFPNMASLEQMLLYELDRNLRAIAGEGSLQDIVFKLIQTAHSEEWVEDLICAAYNSNPGNPKLQSILQKLSLKKSNDLRRVIENRLEWEYDNLEELGTGAFGITYRATIKNEQKDIVIKTIKFDELYQILKSNNQEISAKFNQAIKSFEKEAEILSTFKHSNIVKYHDHLTQKFKFLMKKLSDKQNEKFYLIPELELLFLVMEYIEGENLEELVGKRGAPLEEAEALRYIQQIGDALTVVHGKGVLHRDIKPKNIMVRKAKNEAVLIDFGIAREFNLNVTQTHTVSFTQGYAPPEQLNPKAKRGDYTDIYGLAATLYYLLTQEHPIHALCRLTQPLDEPKKLNSNISNTVNEVILWGMELEPSKRPQIVQQWLAKLSSETPIELKPPQEVPIQPSILVEPTSDDLLIARNADFIQPEIVQSWQTSNLNSDRGVDYTRLRDLLKAGQWKEANDETNWIMLQVAQRTKEGWLHREYVLSFPCKDLSIIDRLWTEYSRGHFGFSVQKQIWFGVGGEAGVIKDELYDKFGESIGWRRNGSWIWFLSGGYNNFQFTLDAPLGHLPAPSLEDRGWTNSCVAIASLSQRLTDCNIGNERLRAIAEGVPNHAPLTPPNSPQKQSHQPQKILILAAIPHGLRLDKEICSIEEAIRRATNRDLFEIKIRTAVRPADIRRAIAEEQPSIVHFCGHGLKDGSLLLEDESGNHKPVSPRGLVSLFRLHAERVKCVLLNACYSSKSAEAIGQHVNYVIGMNQPIQDRAAIVFAQGFYDGLGYDNVNNQAVIQRAYDEGIVAIELENLLQNAVPSLWENGVLCSESIVEVTPVSQSNNLSSNQNRVAPAETPESRRQQPAPSDDLSSDRNVDYIKLRNFLRAGQWKEADEETFAVMLKVTGREKDGWLDAESIENFPCTDLHTIDQLWVKYSNRRFGFSVQKQIYLEVGGIPDGNYYEEAWKKFGARVGWRVKESWISYNDGDTFVDTTAPCGHLPLVFFLVGFGLSSVSRVLARSGWFVFSRIETCKL